ncbi:hypothetical protein ISG33_05760 [Glaciecola sp. MH2013]|uniref:hypothetical protein n=1 Tax=Glaciecola sp. MH2013 TaxID=2785524 RepID=UPI00189F1FD6|nr:hypothetical protein [Glaciecola sp. MH2013]MBF7072904.1 hypothetical protein [Glaciecola sp. MH2013]
MNLHKQHFLSKYSKNRLTDSASIHSPENTTLALPNTSKRWTALVSTSSKMLSTTQAILHVRPDIKHTAFDIIERLLFSKNCALIHTTEYLSLSQIERLLQMASFSGTELVFIGSIEEFNNLQQRQLA